MALRIGLKPALPLIPLLPGLSLLGVLVVLLRDGHGGGLSVLQQFAAGAVQPSIDPIVLGSLLNGLQITLVIAVMSWGISSVLGVGLGLLSSSTFWEILADVRWPAVILRRWLAPLRAVHELIWGLLLLQVFGLNGWVAICAIAIPYTVLMARVIADQVDCHVSPAIPVLKGAGATPWAVMLTGLVPPLAEPISDHIGHRLDCALRSALILGVFGLGGLGTDLSLSLRSLQFQELWSGLWLLAIAMVVLDRLLRTLRSWSRMLILPVAMASPWVALGWGTQLDLQLAWPVAEWSMVVGNLIDGSQGFNAALEISWPGVIGATVWITLIAGCVATGLPPLLLLVWPSQASLRSAGSGVGGVATDPGTSHRTAAADAGQTKPGPGGAGPGAAPRRCDGSGADRRHPQHGIAFRPDHEGLRRPQPGELALRPPGGCESRLPHLCDLPIGCDPARHRDHRHGGGSRSGLAADGSPQLVSLVVGALDRADLRGAHTAG